MAHLTNDQKVKIVELLSKGKSIRSIAAEIGCSKKTAHLCQKRVKRDH